MCASRPCCSLLLVHAGPQATFILKSATNPKSRRLLNAVAPGEPSAKCAALVEVPCLSREAPHSQTWRHVSKVAAMLPGVASLSLRPLDAAIQSHDAG